MFYTNKQLRIYFWEYVLFFYEYVLFILQKKDSCAALGARSALPCNHTIQSASEASFSSELFSIKVYPSNIITAEIKIRLSGICTVYVSLSSTMF